MSGGVLAWSAAAAAAALLSAGPHGQQAAAFPDEDPMDVLVTQSGTVLRSDARLFALYAAFNALGYDDASVKAQKPFARHQFPSMRREVRRRVQLTPKTAAAWERLLDEAPLEAAEYEACALEACPGALGQLPQLLLDVWREGGLADLYPAAALDARQRLLPMLPKIDAAESALHRRMRGTDAAVQGTSGRKLTVILNVLSARPAFMLPVSGTARAVSVGEEGAGEEALLFDVTRRLASAAAEDACAADPAGSGRNPPLSEAAVSALAAVALGLDASALPAATPGGRDEAARLMNAGLTPERICGPSPEPKKIPK